MNAKKIRLSVFFSLVFIARMTVEAVAESRTVTVAPSAPMARQRVLFTAHGFRTPHFLKWDMGDGTVMTSGSRASTGHEAVQSHVYDAPGRYSVQVFDEGGDTDLPPVTVRVTVSAESAASAVRSDPPEAKRLAEIDETVEEPAGVEPEFAEVPSAPVRRPKHRKYPLVKLGPYGGYFKPQDMWFKKIYGEGDVMYGPRLGIHVWNGFYVWFSFSQYKSISKTTYTGDKTTLTLLPASVFLRFDIGRFFSIPYIGVGYTFMSFKEESPDHLGNTKGNSGGIAFEAGFEFRINRHVYLDLGARFDQMKFKPENPNLGEIELGGPQAGISLLISF